MWRKNTKWGLANRGGQIGHQPDDARIRKTRGQRISRCPGKYRYQCRPGGQYLRYFWRQFGQKLRLDTQYYDIKGRVQCRRRPMDMDALWQVFGNRIDDVEGGGSDIGSKPTAQYGRLWDYRIINVDVRDRLTAP